ncbi:MAG: 2-C-methyl-D-erythritol 4-phosphate cytidylyltransferase [Acidobacteria bacterium]|nr:2-C-methyl-D-erythritol 4-phosphate cytidylyltransferase [Acidobacteriota bacterium]
MNVAIIVAAGQGTRMGGERAKQFLELAGIPIIIHTLRAFERCAIIQEIIVVLAAAEAAGFLSLAGQYSLQKLTKVVPGGATRSESVLHGLKAVRAATAEVIAVHDGVRPFVTADEIARTVAAAAMHEAAVLVAPVTDTVKEVVDDRIVRTPDRRSLRRALTPQCFSYALLRRAYEEADVLDPELTDDSALVERLGHSVAIVEGNSRNIKITTPQDIVIAEAMIKEGLWS